MIRYLKTLMTKIVIAVYNIHNPTQIHRHTYRNIVKKCMNKLRT